MGRANRALRRRMRSGAAPAVVHRDEHVVMTLPGLPGGPPYTPREVQERVMEELLDAIRAMTPGMAWRADMIARGWRFGKHVPRRIRFVLDEAPGGLGQGVVLGEFTDAPVAPRRRIVLPGDLPLSGRGLIVPGRGTE